tara:strand:- start:721 stop:855 length:135 start_codon:yes stop_codon:yes gene_type:complete
LFYHDLRVAEITREKATMARKSGAFGFAYYFYWFSGKLVMQKYI